MVFLPPRFGKSELTSRRYPGWVLGRNPDWNVGIVSYGAELAEELSADARRVVLSDEYADVFGSRYAPEHGSSIEIDRASKAINHWRIAGRRGGVRAVGVGGALTGRGFNVLIIDDPIKGRKEADSELVREDLWKWYQGTLRTRLEPGGGILVIQTRWHHDDLAGRLLRDQAGRWTVVAMPAIAEDADILGRSPGEPLDPVRFDSDELAEIRADISSRDWVAQYQQKPTPDEGSIFKRDWFRIESPVERPGTIYHVWDTAFSERSQADYSVCTIWRVEQTGYRLLHVFRDRLTYPRLKDQLYALASNPAWRPRGVIIEDIGSGKSLVQDIRNESRLPIITYRPDRDKIARAHAVTHLFESGRVVITQAPWNETYLAEMTQFPSAEHDDMVDSTTMALSVIGVWNAPQVRRTVVRDFSFAPA
jgi:predicted phage terminase large subunit-like protein